MGRKYFCDICKEDITEAERGNVFKVEAMHGNRIGDTEPPMKKGIHISDLDFEDICDKCLDKLIVKIKNILKETLEE